jgi:hypothetical protein
MSEIIFRFPDFGLKQKIQSLGSYDRASWAKYEERRTNKMQQLDVYY